MWVANVGTDSLEVYWSSSNGTVTNYTVFEGTSPTALDSSFSASNLTNYNVTQLDPATTYYFAVQAWNGSLASSISAPVEATTQPRTNLSSPAPEVPTGLLVTGVETTAVGIRWIASNGTVTNYTVYVGTDLGALTRSLSVGDAVRVNVTGLEPGTTYYLTAQAWNGSSPSGQSAAVNATTLSAPAAPLPPAVPIVPATGSTTLGNWLSVMGTLLGTIGAVVLPLVLVSRATTAARLRAHRQPYRRTQRNALRP